LKAENCQAEASYFLTTEVQEERKGEISGL